MMSCPWVYTEFRRVLCSNIADSSRCYLPRCNSFLLIIWKIVICLLIREIINSDDKRKCEIRINISKVIKEYKYCMTEASYFWILKYKLFITLIEKNYYRYRYYLTQCYLVSQKNHIFTHFNSILTSCNAQTHQNTL